MVAMSSQRWAQPSVSFAEPVLGPQANTIQEPQSQLYNAFETPSPGAMEQLDVKVRELASLRNAAYGPVELVAEPGTLLTGCNGSTATVGTKLPPAPAASVHTIPRSMMVSPGPDDETLRQGRMMRERRQLIDWGENLYKQVERLEQDRSDLERRYMDSQGELEQTRRRCAELERVLHEGGGAGSASAVGENNDLRKQLAAYAVEIDVLREEKSGLERTIGDAQQTIHRLGLDHEGFMQQVNDLNSSHSTLKKKLEQTDSQRASESKQKTALEARISELQKELTAAKESLQHEQDQHRRRLDELSQASQHGQHKDERYEELLGTVQPLKDTLKALQDDYVRQTMEFSQFIDIVRHKQTEAEQGLQDALREVTAHGDSAYKMGMEMDRLKQEHSENLDSSLRAQQESNLGLEQQLQGARHELAQAQYRIQQGAAMEQQLRAQAAQDQAEIQKLQAQLGRRKDTGPGPAWAKRAHQQNITKEMKLCRDGRDLWKVHEGSSQKKETRFVQINDWEMLMKWSKTPGKMTSTCTSLDLYSVIRLDYGPMSRPSVLHDGEPWLCFSLYSTKRSYDFICPNEEVVRAFVLTISRLCNWASGVIPTRQKFESLKGWCKIEEQCYKNKTSLPVALIKAAGITSRRQQVTGLSAPGERTQYPGTGSASSTPPTPNMQSSSGAPPQAPPPPGSGYQTGLPPGAYSTVQVPPPAPGTPGSSYQQPPPSGAYQQPPPSGAYQQPPPSSAYQQPPPSGAYQQPPPSGAYQQPPPGVYSAAPPPPPPRPSSGGVPPGVYQPAPPPPYAQSQGGGTPYPYGAPQGQPPPSGYSTGYGCPAPPPPASPAGSAPYPAAPSGTAGCAGYPPQ